MRKDLSGENFGKLTVIKYHGKDKSCRNSMYLCRCVCGNEKIINRCSLVNGDSKSCGCIRNMPLVERVKQNILIDKNGCWNWTKSLRRGYGAMLKRSAHRQSYEIFVGKIPENMFVLHKCDNRRCVNPNHLYIGDQEDNMRDMIERNRQNCLQGENHQNSIFSHTQIQKIRQDYEKVKNFAEVARMHGIKPNRVQKIVKRLVYKCVS